MSKMARDCDFFRGAVILINRLGLFYENKHTYIGYTVGFSEEARWCCFPFTAFFFPPSLHLSASPFPSLYSQPSFYSHCSPLPLLLGAISDLFGRAELRECLFPKKRKEEGYVPSQLTPRIKSILTDYPRVSLSPKT